MTRICPHCGAPALDDQSVFCNKCGSTFPEDQPKKVLVRTTPRPADTPLPPLQEPVVAPPAPAMPEYHAPAAPAVQQFSEPPRARAPVNKSPVRRLSPVKSALPFSRLMGREFLKPVYWLGVIAIILVVFAGITAGSQTTGTATDAAGDTESDTSSTNILSGIPLFWIGVFIIANLLWRIVCEMSAALFALHDTAGAMPSGTANEHGFDSFPEEDLTVHDTGIPAGEMVSCPRCGKIVPAEDIHTCEHCGSEGCSSCIRLMGLIKKTWTCRDCFEKK